MGKHGGLLRGFDNVSKSSVRDQRFGRMFRNLPSAPADEQALLDLGKTMLQGEFAARAAAGQKVDPALNESEPNDENPTIPAGYTYFGQFVDHDITFDPASSLDRFNDPDALQDFRTPRLDLDSMYGSGPDDQPFLYSADGAHLLLGDDRDFNKNRKKRPDLPRNTAQPRRALTGDKRNDENLIVSQLHATFLRFHNKVLDMQVGNGPATPDDFLETQRIVRWHYQWIVLHDFLKRIVGEETYRAVIGGPGQTPNLRFYDAKGRYAFIPVEFSAAAYRYGHSQVRPSYALNQVVTSARPSSQTFGVADDGGTISIDFNRIPIFSLPQAGPSSELANINGFRELPDFWAVDWGYFLPDVAADGLPNGADGRPMNDAVLPQPSYKIDTVLVDPLTFLPDHMNEKPGRRALAQLNLVRGWRLGLPSGQAVAHRMGVTALTDAQLFTHAEPARSSERQALLSLRADVFEENAPLWFYILREAEILGDSKHLGPVGGTIVAEVLAGLIQEDRQSFLSQWPTWQPELPGKAPGTFTLSDMVNFANA